MFCGNNEEWQIPSTLLYNNNVTGNLVTQKSFREIIGKKKKDLHKLNFLKNHLFQPEQKIKGASTRVKKKGISWLEIKLGLKFSITFVKKKIPFLRQLNKLTENVELHKILLDISTKDKKNALTEI